MSISIITATFNCSETIQDCIDSVFNQVYKCREHIIIDGGSSDNTLAILKSNANKFSCVVSEADDGIYDALNKGIKASKGEVIGFLHADDIYASKNSLVNIAKLFENPEICAVYSDLHYVKKNNFLNVVRKWKSSNFQIRKLGTGWMPPHPTLYVRRKWYEEIGGFDTRYKIAADYYSILLLFSKKNFNAAYLPEVTIKMRTGGESNKSIVNILRKSFEDYDALRRTNVGGLFTLICKNLRKAPQFLWVGNS